MQKDLRLQTRYYLLAIAVSAVVGAVRYSLYPVLGEEAPLLAFVLAVTVFAYCGGTGPGLAATVLSAAAGVHWSLGHERLLSLPYITHITIFLFVGGTISYFSGRWKTSGRRMLAAHDLLRQSNQQAESALKELIFYKHALDEHAIVAITDGRGRITDVNDKFCQISKYSREELIGQDHRILNSGYHPRTFFTEMYAAIAAGRAWHGEIKNRAKDGSEYWVQTTIVPFKGADGRIARYMAIRADITDLKRVEAELRASETRYRGLADELEQRIQQRTADLASANAALKESQERLRHAKEAAEAASQAKSGFLANMSHEIRTPLTAIFGYADLLLIPDQDPNDRAECAQTIRRNGEHLLSIINDILDISKIEAGKMTVERIPAGLPQILKDVMSLMCKQAIAKGIELRLCCPLGMPEQVETDPTRLRQILLNLVGNAVKFTERGFVEIRIGAQEQMLTIVVADTGIGMSEEQQAAIFAPFTQADPSHARKYGGTGLGLAICQRLIALLDGQLFLESRKGVGSTFTVSLPVGDLKDVAWLNHVPQVILALPSESWMGQETFRGRVLVAEDSTDNQQLICAYLKSAGLEVDLADNGSQAVARAVGASHAGRPFDLILMDIQMPEMDGYAATSSLRARGYKGPIVALTANAMDHERDRALASGCDHFLTKPIQADTFLRVIRHYLTHREKSAEGSAGKLVSELKSDAVVAPLIEQFLTELKTKVSTMHEAVDAGDMAKIVQLAHQIKGAAAGYGFPQITDAARCVEQAGKCRQTAGLIGEPVRQLTELCDRAVASS